MRNLLLCAVVSLCGMGCAAHPSVARASFIRHTYDHEENLRFSTDRAIRKQEQEDKLDQLMWIK